MLADYALTVMPLSLSTCSLSRYYGLSLSLTIVPVISKSLSARVLLPWSMWAMMQKERIYSRVVIWLI